MSERSWIFSLVTLLAVFLSYEVFAGRSFPREQLILTEFSSTHYAGSYAQEDEELRFQAALDSHNILVFAVQTPRKEHRGMVSVGKLNLVSAPGEGDFDKKERALVFDLVEALKAEVADRKEPATAALSGFIGALSYWLMRAPSEA